MMLTLTAPFLVGQRPIANRPDNLHLCLFHHFKCVPYLDAEVPDCTFKFRVAEQQLERPEVLRATKGLASLWRHCGVIAATFGQARATAIRIFASSMTPRGVIETSTIEDNDAAPRHCGVTRR